jgi:hypothetical protein
MPKLRHRLQRIAKQHPSLAKDIHRILNAYGEDHERERMFLEPLAEQLKSGLGFQMQDLSVGEHASRLTGVIKSRLGNKFDLRISLQKESSNYYQMIASLSGKEVQHEVLGIDVNVATSDWVDVALTIIERVQEGLAVVESAGRDNLKPVRDKELEAIMVDYGVSKISHIPKMISTQGNSIEVKRPAYTKYEGTRFLADFGANYAVWQQKISGKKLVYKGISKGYGGWITIEFLGWD